MRLCQAVRFKPLEFKPLKGLWSSLRSRSSLDDSVLIWILLDPHLAEKIELLIVSYQMTWNVIYLSSSHRGPTRFAVVFTSEHIPQAWISCPGSDESQYYATRVRKLIAESDLPMKQRWFIQQVQKELFFWPLAPRSTDSRQFCPNRRSQKQELNVWPPTHAVITKGYF